MKQLSPLIVTVFGIGYLPYAPGTFGSLFGLIAGGTLILTSPSFCLWVGIGLTLAVGIASIHVYLRNFPEKKDPQEIVIDEVLGQFIALLASETFFEMALAFGLFRLFDIYKPWPVSWADRIEGSPLKNTVGILLDDILSGLIALAGVWILKGF